MQKENELRKLYGKDEALSNRNINYAYYCKLLSLSKFNPDTQIRYLTKQSIAELKLYRNQNGYRKFREKISKLVNNGLIYEDAEAIYFSDCERFFMTEKDTLQFLVNVSNDDVLRTYVFLGKMFNWAKNKPEHARAISIETICIAIGRNYDAYNKRLIKDVLNMLKNCRLIEYSKDDRLLLTTTQRNSSANNIILTKVNIKYKK